MLALYHYCTPRVCHGTGAVEGCAGGVDDRMYLHMLKLRLEVEDRLKNCGSGAAHVNCEAHMLPSCPHLPRFSNPSGSPASRVRLRSNGFLGCLEAAKTVFTVFVTRLHSMSGQSPHKDQTDNNAQRAMIRSLILIGSGNIEPAQHQSTRQAATDTTDATQPLDSRACHRAMQEGVREVSQSRHHPATWQGSGPGTCLLPTAHCVPQPLL